MIDEDTMNLVVPGDLITSEEGFMKYLTPYAVAMGRIALTTKYTPLS